MKNIYLVRHCKYENPDNMMPGRLPVPLSEEGKKQAEKIADYFTDKRIEKIVNSAVLRCKQTSKIISNGKIPITYDKRLLETTSAYQGYSFRDRKLEWHVFYRHTEELGGETLNDVQKRMISFWQELIKGSESRVIISSHGDPLYCLNAYLKKEPLIDPVGYLLENDDYYWVKGTVVKVKIDDEENSIISSPIEF